MNPVVLFVVELHSFSKTNLWIYMSSSLASFLAYFQHNYSIAKDIPEIGQVGNMVPFV
jgi:hypothetical protein